MKKYIFILLAAFTIVSCSDDEQVLGPTGTVNLNFKATYSDEPLVFQNFDFQYKYPDGKEVFFSTLKFFISDVVLLEEEGGGEIELTDIDYVNFSDNSTLADAEQPISLSIPFIPAGKYKGIRLGIGVPADLNNSAANQFGAGHPLRENFGEFWAGWESFIFVKLEGLYDGEGNGINVGTDAAFAHHLGSDPTYRTVTISKPIELKGDQAFDLNLVLDVKKLYERDNDLLDLSNPDNLKTHDPENLSVATYMMDNFERALTSEQ